MENKTEIKKPTKKDNNKVKQLGNAPMTQDQINLCLQRPGKLKHKELRRMIRKGGIANIPPGTSPHPNCTKTLLEIKELSQLIPIRSYRRKYVSLVYNCGANPQSLLQTVLSLPEIQDRIAEEEDQGYVKHTPTSVSNYVEHAQRDEQSNRGVRGGVPPRGGRGGGPSRGGRGALSSGFVTRGSRGAEGAGPSGRDSNVHEGPSETYGPPPGDDEFQQECQRLISNISNFEAEGLGGLPLDIPLEPYKEDEGASPDREPRNQRFPPIANLPGIDGPLKEEYERLMNNVSKIGEINMDVAGSSEPGPSGLKRRNFNEEHRDFADERDHYWHAGIDHRDDQSDPIERKRPRHSWTNQPDSYLDEAGPSRSGITHESQREAYGSRRPDDMPPRNYRPPSHQPPRNRERRGNVPPEYCGPRGSRSPFQDRPPGKQPLRNRGPPANRSPFRDKPSGTPRPSIDERPPGNQPPRHRGPPSNQPRRIHSPGSQPLGNPRSTFQDTPSGDRQPSFNDGPPVNMLPISEGPSGQMPPLYCPPGYPQSFHYGPPGNVAPFNLVPETMPQFLDPSCNVIPFNAPPGNMFSNVPVFNSYPPGAIPPASTQFPMPPDPFNIPGTSSGPPVSAQTNSKSRSLAKIPSSTFGDPTTPLFIVPSKFPLERLSDEQMDTIENAILEAILEIDDERMKPSFQDSFRSDGRYGVICNDQSSKNWLFHFISRCQPWPFASLKIISPQTTRVKAFAKLPLSKNDDNDKILRFIAKQNAELKVNLWKLLHRLDGPTSTSLALEIDEESAKLLKEDRSINFKMGRAEIIVAKDGEKEEGDSEPDGDFDPAPWKALVREDAARQNKGSSSASRRPPKAMGEPSGSKKIGVNESSYDPKGVHPTRSEPPRSDRRFRTPSPPRSDRRFRTPSPEPPRSDRRFHTPSPPRSDRRFRTPSPPRSDRRFQTPSPPRSDRRFHMPSPEPPRSDRRFCTPSPPRSDQRFHMPSPEPPRSDRRFRTPTPEPPRSDRRFRTPTPPNSNNRFFRTPSPETRIPTSGGHIERDRDSFEDRNRYRSGPNRSDRFHFGQRH